MENELKAIIEGIYPEGLIIEAAKGLASLVNIHGKPVVFDMHEYMAITIAKGDDAVPSPALMEKVNSGHLSSDDMDEFLALHMAQLQRHSDLEQFVTDLNDALTTTEVCDICSCVLAEIGHTDEYPSLGDEVLVYVVSPIPREADCFILQL